MNNNFQLEYDVVELLIKGKDEAILWTTKALKYAPEDVEFKTILLTSLIHFVAHKLNHVTIEDAMYLIDRDFFIKYNELCFYLNEELYSEHKNSVH